MINWSSVLHKVYPTLPKGYRLSLKGFLHTNTKENLVGGLVWFVNLTKVNSTEVEELLIYDDHELDEVVVQELTEWVSKFSSKLNNIKT